MPTLDEKIKSILQGKQVISEVKEPPKGVDKSGVATAHGHDQAGDPGVRDSVSFHDFPESNPLQNCSATPARRGNQRYFFDTLVRRRLGREGNCISRVKRLT